MKDFRLLYIALLLVTPTGPVYSQIKQVNVNPDDRAGYNYRSAAELKMHLTDMTVVKDGRHWRFWYDKYVAGAFAIDVMGADSLNCKASVTIYTYGDVVWNEENKFGKIYHEQIDLSPDAARALYHAATRVDISRFATRDTLENSIRVYSVTDAMPPTVEYADDDSYIFRTGLRTENVAQFKAVISTATKLVDFEKLKDSFEKHIPFGYYSADQWVTINHKLTPKQLREYKRYWRKQL